MDQRLAVALDLFILFRYDKSVSVLITFGKEGKPYALYLQFRRLQPRRFRTGGRTPSAGAQAPEAHRHPCDPDPYQHRRDGAGGAGVLLCGAARPEPSCGGILLLCVPTVRRVLRLRCPDLRISGHRCERVSRLCEKAVHHTLLRGDRHDRSHRHRFPHIMGGAAGWGIQQAAALDHR